MRPWIDIAMNQQWIDATQECYAAKPGLRFVALGVEADQIYVMRSIPTYIESICFSIICAFIFPVLPRKAVAEISKIGNLWERWFVVMHGGRANPLMDRKVVGVSGYLSIDLSIYLFIYLPNLSVYLSIYLLCATTPCTSWTYQLPNVLRAQGVFNILVSKCASRQSRVGLFHISTSNSASTMIRF